MKVATHLGEIECNRNSVVTVGMFDGVHEAHRRILGDVVERSKALGGRSVAITFEPHPRQVLSGSPVSVLTSPQERQALIEDIGIDLLLVVPFTYEFSRQSSREFFEKYLIYGVGVSEVVEGYDHHFGRDREGSVEELVRLGKEFNFSVVAVKPVTIDGEVVSSSSVRQHLLSGRVERARVLLGRPYGLAGSVLRGNGRGKELGYPTANLQPLWSNKLIPQNGIYFAKVLLASSTHAGMVSIGVRPTFEANGRRVVEVHLLDFDGDLYGQHVHVQFLKRLRDEMKFDSADALIEQMHRDREASVRLQQEFMTMLR
jgi:riboflavin kinase/FMN adenylyltransferase